VSIIDTLGHAALDNKQLHFRGDVDLTDAESWLVALSAPLAAFNGSYVDALETRDDNDSLRQSVAQSWGVQDRTSFEGTVQWLVAEGHRDSYFKLWTAMRKMADIRRSASPVMRLFAGGWVEARAHRAADAVGLAAQTGMEPREVAQRLAHSQHWVHDVDAALQMDTGTLRSLVAWDAVRLVNLSRWALQLGWINSTEFVSFAGRLSPSVREAYGAWSEVSAAYVVAGLVWSYSKAREEGLLRTAGLLGEDPRSPYLRLSFR
jgi:hypothetical protein